MAIKFFAFFSDNQYFRMFLVSMADIIGSYERSRRCENNIVQTVAAATPPLRFPLRPWIMPLLCEPNDAVRAVAVAKRREYTHKTLFPVAHQEHSSTNNTAQWHWDIQGTLRLSNHFYSSIRFSSLLYIDVYSLFYSTLFFYCFLFCVSQAIGKPSPAGFYLKKNVSPKHVCPCKVVRKINATNNWFIQ